MRVDVPDLVSDVPLITPLKVTFDPVFEIVPPPVPNEIVFANETLDDANCRIPPPLNDIPPEPI